MRVIAGKYRSRTIQMPKGAEARPTKDRVREALFNILGASVNGAAVLDAFAGSGAFGIEAVSRGAKRVVFVDIDKRCIVTVKKNLEALGISDDAASLIRADAIMAFDTLERRKEKFDIVLFDPPYYSDTAKKSLIKIDARDILTPRCIVVVEHHKNDALPEELDVITSYRIARYGDIRLSFYRLKK